MGTLIKHPKISLATLIILSGLFLGLFLQDELFGHYLSAVFGLICLGPTFLLLAVGAFVRWLVQRKVGKWLEVAITILGSSVVAIFVFLVTNGWVDAWKNKAVERYVARAVPILDQIKTKNGAYPTVLPVAILGEPPELLRKYGDYTSDGTGFRFEYVDDPAGWAGGEGALEFDSEKRKWAEDR